MHFDILGSQDDRQEHNHLKIMIRHLAKTYRKQYFSGVLGIEQFELGHHNGGSQDNSRIMCVHN
jgi:hypothetical protein